MVELDSLREASLLQGLSADQRATLAACARDVAFGAGEYLFRYGDPVETLYLLRSGRIELTMPLKVIGVQKEIVIEELEPGATLAWSALVAPHRLTTSARAVTESKLIAFSRAELIELCERVPSLGFRVMTNLAGVVGRRLHVTKAMWLLELQHSVGEEFG